MSDKSSIKTIFNSIQAVKVYKDLPYYRSENIFVPPGYVALIELTTHKDFLSRMSFTAIRTPQPTTWDECYQEQSKDVAKIFRRWKCCQSLGEDIPDTNIDDFNKSVVRWGYDNYTQELVEFEFIDRPGNYYIMIMKCNAPDIENCANPTIIEASIIKARDAIQLGYPCYKSCPTDPVVEPEE